MNRWFFAALAAIPLTLAPRQAAPEPKESRSIGTRLAREEIVLLPQSRPIAACTAKFSSDGSFSCSQIVCGDSSCPIVARGRCALTPKQAPEKKPLLACRYTKECQNSRCSAVQGSFFLPLPGSFMFDLFFRGAPAGFEEPWSDEFNLPELTNGCLWKESLSIDGSFRCAIQLKSGAAYIHGTCPLHETPDDAQQMTCTTTKLCAKSSDTKEPSANPCKPHVHRFSVRRPER